MRWSPNSEFAIVEPGDVIIAARPVSLHGRQQSHVIDFLQDWCLDRRCGTAVKGGGGGGGGGGVRRFELELDASSCGAVLWSGAGSGSGAQLFEMS